MKKSFPEYYYPAESEFAELWAQCIFALDANVLLNVYRYSKPTRDQLLGVLEKVSSRLWVPHQAALEYQRDRLEVIGQQVSPWDKINDHLKRARDSIERELSRLSKHPFIDKKDLMNKISIMFGEIQAELDNSASEHVRLLHDDPLRETLTALLDGKVGSPYTEEEFKQVVSDGRNRYENHIPPGYEDSGKEEAVRYGDLIIWYQILDRAKETQKPVIFVTDDTKEDWWKRARGQFIGPRIELVKEMLDKAGVRFHMYQVEQFMNWAQHYLNQPVAPEAIEEARRVREEEREHLAHRLQSIRQEIEQIRAQIEDDDATLAVLGSSTNPPQFISDEHESVEDERRIIEDQIRKDQAALESLSLSDPEKDKLLSRIQDNKASLDRLKVSPEPRDVNVGESHSHRAVLERIKRNKSVLEQLWETERQILQDLSHRP